MVMFLGGSVSISEACEVVALISIYECVVLGASKIAKYMFDYFPVDASWVVKKLR